MCILLVRGGSSNKNATSDEFVKGGNESIDTGEKYGDHVASNHTLLLGMFTIQYNIPW